MGEETPGEEIPNGRREKTTLLVQMKSELPPYHLSSKYHFKGELPGATEAPAFQLWRGWRRKEPVTDYGENVSNNEETLRGDRSHVRGARE